MIQPVVEGHGEVEAVPLLLRRLCAECSAFGVEVGKSIRRKRSELLAEDSFRRGLRLALLQPRCSSVLIIFDADDDCPKELAPQLEQWAHAEAGHIPCAVVMASREYEAWLLASAESFRGYPAVRDDAVSHPDPETPRDAKGRLGDLFKPEYSYSPVVDQPKLTARFDMAEAYAKCRSFRHLTTAFGRLLAAEGLAIQNWPPETWQARP